MFNLVKKLFYSKRKKTVCICGNCVTGVIPDFLQTSNWFNKHFECKKLTPIYLLNTKQDIDDFKKSVSMCDVFLTQPIGGEKYKNMGIDTESIKKILKPKAKFFAIPTPYFIGYFPEQMYLHDSNGIMIGECEGLPMPYHNKIILYGYVHKLSPEKTFDLLYGEQNTQKIKKLVQESIMELKRREQGLSFTISDFIEQNFRKTRLFWSLNHPTNVLICYICEQILKLLSDGAANDIKNIPNEFLNSYVTPILPGVEKALNFEITSDCDNTRWTLDLVKDTYAYYDKHPELVESNTKFIEDMWVK